MAKLCLKKKSKRISLSKKYRIQKKVREHNRKVRREARKNPQKAKNKKTLHIPNLCPFKEEMLLEMKKMKEKQLEEQKAAKEARKIEKAKLKEGVDLNTMLVDAAQKQTQYEQNQSESFQNEPEKEVQDKAELSLKKFYKEFKKVVAESTVILEVLDARDPIGTRCKRLEDCVLQSKDKRLVLVLNKADLIPKENLERWLKYLKQFFPTVPFKANTQEQKRNLSQHKKFKKTSPKVVESSSSVGVDLLMSLLANYCRHNDVKRAITVGVVGMPNVGKSSIINSLKRSRSCAVGAAAGLTKKMQEVKLDSKIRILDCPGVCYPEGDSNEYSLVVLKNAARVENIVDPLGAVTAILIRVNKEQMKEQYKLNNYSTVNEFLCLLAKRYGMMRKGGVPDTIKAARILIEDWNRGRIKHYTEPPELGEDVHIDAQIVQTMAKEFDINSFEAMETEVIESLKDPNATYIEANAPKMDIEEKGLEKAVEIQGAVEGTNLISESVKVEKSKKVRRRKKKENKEKPDSQLQLEGNQKLNNQKKLKFKKLKKEKARRARDALNLATTLDSISLGGSNEEYDFNTDLNIK